MAMDNSTPSRHEKSLGLLTTKFVSLLQEAKDGVLDLKVVSYLMLQKLFFIHVSEYLHAVVLCLQIFKYCIHVLKSRVW